MIEYKIIRSLDYEGEDWDGEIFTDVGNNFPPQKSERDIMIQVLQKEGIKIACIEIVKISVLEKILLENNVYINFIDSKGD